MKTRPRFPFGIFFAVFISVFLIVVMVSVISTSLLPRSYMSEARIEVKHVVTEPGHNEKTVYDPATAVTESQFIASEIILGKVIADLKLNDFWGKKYFNNQTLKTWEALAILKGRTLVQPVHDTTLIRIREYDDNPESAATVANAMAKAYVGYIATNGADLRGEIIDTAYPMKIPVKPNVSLNYFMGAVFGILVGLGAGVLVAFIFFLANRKRSIEPTPPQKDTPDP